MHLLRGRQFCGAHRLLMTRLAPLWLLASAPHEDARFRARLALAAAGTGTDSAAAAAAAAASSPLRSALETLASFARKQQLRSRRLGRGGDKQRGAEADAEAEAEAADVDVDVAALPLLLPGEREQERRERATFLREWARNGALLRAFFRCSDACADALGLAAQQVRWHAKESDVRISDYHSIHRSSKHPFLLL